MKDRHKSRGFYKEKAICTLNEKQLYCLKLVINSEYFAPYEAEDDGISRCQHLGNGQKAYKQPLSAYTQRIVDILFGSN